MELDVVVSGGTVIDGTGAPRFRGDGVRGGRIAALSRVPGTLRGARVVDAAHLVVAPGFVDVDSHVDWAVIDGGGDAALGRWLRQGVTRRSAVRAASRPRRSCRAARTSWGAPAASCATARSRRPGTGSRSSST